MRALFLTFWNVGISSSVFSTVFLPQPPFHEPFMGFIPSLKGSEEKVWFLRKWEGYLSLEPRGSGYKFLVFRKFKNDLVWLDWVDEIDTFYCFGDVCFSVFFYSQFLMTFATGTKPFYYLFLIPGWCSF